MAKEPTNKEILTVIKDNQKAIKDNQKAIKNNQKTIKENQKHTKEILEAINAFSTDTDKRFTNIDKRFTNIDKRFTKIEATMVTKDYLDDKLADLRGDLVVLMRKEDNKVKKLVEILKKRDLLSDKEVKEIMSMEPFPQLSL